MKKVRLDQLVFQRGLTPSRERAKTTIMSGRIFVDGNRADKPGMPVSPDSEITLQGELHPFVSRGGLKLQKALDRFCIDPEGFTCIDCGASTGGFTDCLLQAGAARVYAVDVGYGQLAWRLRNDPRVVVLERTNIRHITRQAVPDEIDLAVMDLSFISLKLVLPAVGALLGERGQLICLIKPQFEAGREKVGKKGVVRDPETHLEVLKDFLDCSRALGFGCAGLDYSPIKGPEGNIEYLAHLKAGELEGSCPSPEEIVPRSHLELKEQ